MKKTFHFTFEVGEGAAAVEVTDPATGEVVVQEESCCLYHVLKGIGDPRSLPFGKILVACAAEPKEET